MNVLDFYKPEHVQIHEPIELEDDNYFCKLSYNKCPFILKTNKVCYYKKRDTPNYLYISITSKEYLEWFETFYHDSIKKFHSISKDWFEEEMTLSEIECSFINPLKSNIRDNCFDVMCTMDDNRMMVTDTADNNHTIESVKDHEVIPTFHIKGIKFNSKNFSFDIEIHHMYLLLEQEDNEEEIQEPQELQENEENIVIKPIDIPSAPIQEDPPKVDDSSDVLSEYIMPTEDLTEAEVHLDNLNIYKVYEFLNTKIKENLIEEIRGIFTTRKIKSKIDFSEVVDDEEPDE